MVVNCAEHICKTNCVNIVYLRIFLENILHKQKQRQIALFDYYIHSKNIFTFPFPVSYFIAKVHLTPYKSPYYPGLYPGVCHKDKSSVRGRLADKLSKRFTKHIGLPHTLADSCRKNSTMHSLKEQAVFSFTVPTWFMNEKPPGSREQPTSSPTTNPWLFSSPNVFSVHTVLHCGRSAYARGMSENMDRHSMDSYIVKCVLQEVCLHIVFHFLQLKHLFLCI